MQSNPEFLHVAWNRVPSREILYCPPTYSQTTHLPQNLIITRQLATLVVSCLVKLLNPNVQPEEPTRRGEDPLLVREFNVKNKSFAALNTGDPGFVNLPCLHLQHSATRPVPDLVRKHGSKSIYDGGQQCI